MKFRMSKSIVKDPITSNFSQIGDPPISLQENSHLLCQTSNLNHDFNIDLNKSYDLIKFNEHTNASGGIKTILEPFNKFTFDCTNQEKNTTGKLSTVENLDCLESDESLGILPDLLNDEMTFDTFKTGLGFSDEEIYEGINPEVNKSPAPLVLSPLIDNQFNGISLFLKNISTPLPNFGNDRRCSSTPKISVTNTSDSIENNSSLPFSSDEKEEPIIAGSCRIKFKTDFNLDDLKNVKPLTSTNKAFSPPQLSSIFKEINEELGLKSEVSSQECSQTIENNLNAAHTFSDNVDKLFPCECDKNMQNIKVLNNTFQINKSVSIESVNAVISQDSTTTMKISQEKSNHCNKDEVKKLDSTFAIPEDKFNCEVDCGKTFVIDFDSPIDTELSSESIYKNRIFNETRVLEAVSVELPSKQQEQIANVTFTKDIEDDGQNSFENHSYSSHGIAFKPLTPILEETYYRSNLNKTKDCSKNTLQSINNKSQLTSPDIFSIKGHVTFSENIDKIYPEMNVTQDIYEIQVPSPISPKSCGSNIFFEKAEETSFHEQVNFIENEDDSFNKMSLSAVLQSITIPKEDCSFEILPKSSNTGKNTTFSGKTDGAQNANNQVHISQNSLKEVTNATFSEESCEVQIGLNSIPNEENCQASQKERMNVPVLKLADKDINIQHELHLSQHDRDSIDGTPSNLTKFDLKGTLSKKDTDKHKSSQKSCSLETKTIGKSKLLKPTKIYPRKFSEPLNRQLPVLKSFNEPVNDNRSITFGFNKRLSLVCSSASDDNKSKCKTELNNAFEIPSKIGNKRSNSNSHKAKPELKYSNEHLKNISIDSEKQSLITQPDLISYKNSKIATASSNRLVSSKLSHEKLPRKSIKMKEGGFITTAAYTSEKISDEVFSCPKILDLPKKENLCKIGIDNVDTRKKFSRHSIATNLPRKFPPFNNFNNIYDSKPTVSKQKSAPASNSCKPNSQKAPNSVKLVNSIKKLKFSALPKVQSCAKTLSDIYESKNVTNKRLVSKNEKSNGHIMKPCILEHKAVQFGKSQSSTSHVKQKDNMRGIAGSNSSMFLPSEQAAQPLNSSIRRQTLGKLPLRRIPAPRYNK